MDSIGGSALGAKVIAAASSQTKLDAVKKYAGADHLINYTKPGWQKDVLKITSGHGVDVVYDPVGLIQGLSLRCLLSMVEAHHTSPVDSLKCIAWKGRAVVVGFAGGKIEQVLVLPEQQNLALNVSQLPMNLVLLKNIEITGVHWGAYSGAYSQPFHGDNKGRLFLAQSRNQSTFLPYTKKFSSRPHIVSQCPQAHSSSSILQSGKVTPVIYHEVYPLERVSEGLVALENRQTWGKVVVRVRDEPAPTTKL